MSGNVWEWCQSLSKAYPYREDDGREDLRAGGCRVLRGGSWLNLPSNCRSAFRLWNNPASPDPDCFGFRVIVIPFQEF